MPLTAPITRAEHLTWRAAVLAFKEAHPRGRPPIALHAGVPGSLHHCVSHVVGTGQDLDQTLRTDIAAALLQRTAALHPHRWAWLARGGGLETHDADLAWSSAWTAACAEAGTDVPLVVVTRSGWRDPRNGVGHEWRRLRRRSGVAPG